MKTSPGRSVIFILISLLILANASCNRASEAKKTRIAFITNNTSDFWTIARKGTEKAQANKRAMSLRAERDLERWLAAGQPFSRELEKDAVLRTEGR